MIIPHNFYYEFQDQHLGHRAYFCIGYLRKPWRKVVVKYLPDVMNPNWAVMNNLYVHPKHRGHGFATALLNSLKEWQDKVNVNVLFIVSPYKSGSELSLTELQGMYEKYGFKPVSVESSYYFRRNRWEALHYREGLDREFKTAD